MLARSVLESNEQARRRRIEGRRRRLALLAVALVVTAFVGLIGFRRFVDPRPLPLPTSAVRTISAGELAWPSDGGNLGRTRSTRGPASFQARSAWDRDLGAPASAGLVSDASAVYVSLADRRLIALAADSGREAWSITLDSAVNFTPLLAGDRLYATLPGGNLLAIATATGEIVWDVQFDRSLSASPLIATATGEIVWDVQFDRSLSASPLIAAGTLYLLAGGSIIGLEAENGAELWRRQVDVDLTLTNPAIEDDILVVSTTDRIVLFDRLTGSQIYWYVLPPVIEGIAIVDRTVFASASATIVAISVDSRRPWWEPFRAIWFQFWIWGSAPQTPGPPSDWVARARHDSSPAVAAGKIAVASRGGRVTVRSTENGAELWSRQFGELAEGPIFTVGGLLVTRPTAILLLNPEDGSTLYEHTMFEEISEIAVTGEAIYTASPAGTLRALR